MSYQNFNTNIADPINYGANKFESINTFSNFKINLNKADNHNDGYKEVNIFVKILTLFFILGTLSSIIFVAISIHFF